MQTATLGVFLTAMTCVACSSGPAVRAPAEAPTVMPIEAVNWEQLNPARGDASPRAATLWGNRKGPGRTGFLVRFVDGFQSPPHIHNVTYRGVVIDGLVHNAEPKAEPFWMPNGSFWTQPKGAVHITSAKGKQTTAYIEIDDGPYLVKPVDKAFDSGEVHINAHDTNLVWLDGARFGWPARVRVAHLWGDVDGSTFGGRFVDLPAGFAGRIGATDDLRMVIVRGSAQHAGKTLAPGSAVSSGAGAVELACAVDCRVYLRTRGVVHVSAR